MTDYTTFVDINERLGGTLQPGGLVESKITVASRAIDLYCGQEFGSATVASARTFPVDNQMSVLVDPFHTTTDLVVKTDSDDDGTYETTWSSADYALGRFGGRRANLLGSPYDCIIAVGSHPFPLGNLRPEALQVTAKWGWASTPLPVAEACEILTVELWKRKDTPFGISTASTVEFGPLRIGRDLYAQVAPLLAPFRRMDRLAGIA